MALYSFNIIGDSTVIPTGSLYDTGITGTVTLSGSYPPISPTNYTGYLYPWMLGDSTVLPSTGALQETLLGGKLNTSVTDRVIDFGVLTADSIYTLSITNFTKNTLTVTEINWHALAITGATVDGIIVTDTLAPNETKVFTITAQANLGLSTVSSLFEVVFDSGENLVYDLRIVRASSLVYSLVPDADTYSEKITFKTEVVTFTNGKEARRGLMTTPKRSVGYSSTATSNAIIDYGSNLHHIGMRNNLYQPLWSQMDKIGTALNGNTITLDTDGKDYKVGGYATILVNPLLPILIDIISITPTSIVLSKSLTLSGGFIVTPAFLVLPNKSYAYEASNLRWGKFNFKLEEL